MRMGCTLPGSEKLGKTESSVPKMIFKNETGCKKEERRWGEGSREGGGTELESQFVKVNCTRKGVDKGQGKRPMLFLGKSSVSRVITIHTVDI